MVQLILDTYITGLRDVEKSLENNAGSMERPSSLVLSRTHHEHYLHNVMVVQVRQNVIYDMALLANRTLNVRSFDGQLIHLFPKHGPKFAITCYSHSHSKKCTFTILIMIHIVNYLQTEFDRYFTDWIFNPEHTTFTSKYIFFELDEQKQSAYSF